MRIALALDERSVRDIEVQVQGVLFILDPYAMKLLQDDTVEIRYVSENDSFTVMSGRFQLRNC